jgi:predicted nucleotidyltransferase
MTKVVLTDMLREILDEVAAEADNHDSIAALYIFGSMVRGDHKPTSDLDIALEYMPLDQMAAIDDGSYERWQAEHEEWRQSLERRIGREVHLDRLHIADPESVAWPAVVRARERPVATKGKAAIVCTPPTPK